MSATNIAAATIGALASGGGGSSTRERRKARAEARHGRKMANKLLDPFYDYGTNILAEGFDPTQDASVRFGVDEAMRAASRAGAAGGGRQSGNLLIDLQNRGANVANSLGTDSLNRWLAQVGVGGKAATQMGDNWMNTANLLSGIWSGAANAGIQQGNWQAESLNNVAQNYLQNNTIQNALASPAPYTQFGSSYGINPYTTPSMGTSAWTDNFGYGVG